jgi:AraC-like DNA-binding protein/ligand-binding sensor protein
MNDDLRLFFDEEARELIDSFAQCFKVKINLRSARMREFIVGLQNPGSHFCRLVQTQLGLLPRCERQDEQMCFRCRGKHEMVVYPCYAGPSEAVMPVLFNGITAGYAMVGQFRTREELPPGILALWQKGGFPPETLQRAFLAQPYFEKASLDGMLRLFSMLIKYIATERHLSVSRTDITREIIQWVDAHLTEGISLDRIAGALRRSRSSISHTLKQKLNMSFKQLHTLRRIEFFEQNALLEPDLSVQEGAFRAGFSDPLYFSRVYKKLRHCSPSEYLRSIREKI